MFETECKNEIEKKKEEISREISIQTLCFLYENEQIEGVIIEHGVITKVLNSKHIGGQKID